MLTASIEEDEVPYEEGWVKLRGFPPAFAKAQLVEFVKVGWGGVGWGCTTNAGSMHGGGSIRPPRCPPMQPCAPELTDDDVKVVLSADGTGLGEAFVHLRGPRAKLRLALAKDRSVMPVRLVGAAGQGSASSQGWVWLEGGRGRERTGQVRSTASLCPAPPWQLHVSCRRRLFTGPRPVHLCPPQGAMTPVEVITAMADDLQRRLLSGCMLV